MKLLDLADFLITVWRCALKDLPIALVNPIPSSLDSSSFYCSSIYSLLTLDARISKRLAVVYSSCSSSFRDRDDFDVSN